MNKSKKILIIIIVLLAAAALAVLGYFLLGGSSLAPSSKELETMTEVEEVDILTIQAETEAAILSDYSNGSYTMDEPYVIVDPYSFNPLSALVMFEADSVSDITVTIEGSDEYSTIEYTKSISDAHCEVPVIGLYADKDNKVTLTNAEGTSVELIIATEPLPNDFDKKTLVTSTPEKMEPGLTLMAAAMAQSYTILFDCYGEVRGYVSQNRMLHGSGITLLSNGRMIGAGDEYLFGYNKYTMIEFNWLGKIFKEYKTTYGVHHDIEELPDGNLLVVSNPADAYASKSVEDVIIIVDRETGNVVEEYDYNNIVDRDLTPFPNGISKAYGALIDWMHINNATYDENHNWIIASARTHSYVVCIDADTKEIQWILGADELFEGSFMQDYQLTPVGDNFEIQWCQHEVQIMPDMDGNADTMDIILFDNGQFRSKNPDNYVASSDNYSRGVQFRINTVDMTVEQIWEYGKERGTETYSAILGDANYYETTGNRMMCYGGQLRTKDGEPADVPGAVFASGGSLVSRVVEVTEDNEVVFEMEGVGADGDYSGEVYQAYRVPIYVDGGYDYQLGEITGERVGDIIVEPQVSDISEMPSEFTDNISVKLKKIYKKDARLIIDGSIAGDFEGRTGIGICNVALISKKDTFAFTTRMSTNGAFLASIDLSELPEGEYMISFYGDVTTATKYDEAEFTTGHIQSGYKITIE